MPAQDRFRRFSEGLWPKNGKYEYCYRCEYIYFVYKRST